MSICILQLSTVSAPSSFAACTARAADNGQAAGRASTQDRQQARRQRTRAAGQRRQRAAKRGESAAKEWEWRARCEKSDALAEKVHACPTRRTLHNAMRAYYAAKSGHALIEGCPSANSQRNCPLSPQFPTHSGRAHNCQHNHQPTPVTHIPASSRGSGTTPVRPPVRQHRDSPLPNPTVLNVK